MSFIQLNQVGKTYSNGFTALQPTTVSIEAGTFTVILGPSGAGKSTLLRIINGLETATAGEVIVHDRQLTAKTLRKVRSRTAMVFQQFNLVGRLNVMTNVLTGRLYSSPWWASALYLFDKRDYNIARQALAKVGLTEKAWERADKLSGGQQQRVAIARALAQQPDIILADEPVASLDPVTSEEIMGLLLEICRQDGITVVANLHQVELAAKFADRIIGLNRGRVVFDGAPTELIHQELVQTIYEREDGGVDEQFDLAMVY